MYTIYTVCDKCVYIYTFTHKYLVLLIFKLYLKLVSYCMAKQKITLIRV